MKKVNVKARIKRNMLAELSGKYFIDESSELVRNLNEKGKNAFVGIQNCDELYTVIGYDKIYYSTPSSIEDEILINEFLDILSFEALKRGKSQTYEFIKIKDNESIWVMNVEIMNALWNTMLMFDTRKI